MTDTGQTDPGEILLNDIQKTLETLFPHGGAADRTFAAMLMLSERIYLDLRLIDKVTARQEGWPRILAESGKTWIKTGFPVLQYRTIRKELTDRKRVLVILGQQTRFGEYRIGRLSRENLSLVRTGGLFTLYLPADNLKDTVRSLTR